MQDQGCLSRERIVAPAIISLVRGGWHPCSSQMTLTPPILIDWPISTLVAVARALKINDTNIRLDMQIVYKTLSKLFRVGEISKMGTREIYHF